MTPAAWSLTALGTRSAPVSSPAPSPSPKLRQLGAGGGAPPSVSLSLLRWGRRPQANRHTQTRSLPFTKGLVGAGGRAPSENSGGFSHWPATHSAGERYTAGVWARVRCLGEQRGAGSQASKAALRTLTHNFRGGRSPSFKAQLDTCLSLER